MMRSSWKVLLVLLAVFALGFFSGTLTSHYQFRKYVQREFRVPPPAEPGQYRRPHQKDEMRDRMLDHISRRLQLDAKQREMVKNIMESHLVEIQAAEQNFGTAMRGAVDRTDQEIEKILRPEQKTRFKAWRQQGPPDGEPRPGRPDHGLHPER